ncbi:MAG: hypothetical protein K8T90_18600 [Planctomycetes bacterium]|nr:hypothetical protein [Planctomycetota bacterium]
MAGELVPLVLLPRYTTYAGNDLGGTPYYFTTIALDVTQYQNAIINMWRGKIVGTAGTPPLKVWFQESTDQDSWTVCAGSPGGAAGGDPGENTEAQYTLELKKRWFRIRIELQGDNNVLSCWAVGFLEERLS